MFLFFALPKWVVLIGQKYPKCPQNFLPNLSAQAQQIGIFEKKELSMGVRSLWMDPYALIYSIDLLQKLRLLE